ncbi:MAG: ParB/RepB/Spo0J family partition protein, partial [Rhodocyclaceae bacterium]|nr:ParB/RepB/Spo0J family partition protein [Rhodocyclaceae bacterium]
MQTIEAGTVQMIPRHLIDVPEQVRTKFNENSIKELAADIRRRGGLIQNLTVRPIGNRFELAIGGRRFKAIEYLGDEFVPAIVANISDDELEEMQLAENIQREDLSASDVANSIAKLWKKHKSVIEVARRCNKSRSWVCKRLALALDVGPLTA